MGASMSRTPDLILFAAVLAAAWTLIRYQPAAAGSPITTTVRVRGDAPLHGLGILLREADGHTPTALTDDEDHDISPHQTAPWQPGRTTQITVPGPGNYSVRWGAQVELPPCRAKEVMKDLPREAKIDDQLLRILPGMTHENVHEIDLPAAHGEAIRALVREGGE